MSTKSYYEIATNDYRFLETIRDGEFYNKIGIECQQIAEKYLKYLYVTYIDVSKQEERFIKTYSVHKIALQLNKDLDTNFDYSSLAILTDYYFDTRYPSDEYIDLTSDMAFRALQLIDDLKQSIDKYILENSDECPICGAELLPKGGCCNFNCINSNN
jgi:HEPN domain-containing protein